MEALELKEKTESLLLKEGVPVNEHLPVIEEISELSFASVAEIRKRAVALSYTLAKAFGAPIDMLQKSINEFHIEKAFSPQEIGFINQASSPKEEAAEYQLGVEALWELAWVLGLIPKVSHSSLCGNNLVHLIPKPGEDPSLFLASAQMRSHEAIYEEADLLYRIHWASREANLTGKPEPTGVSEYVIEQRHKAINWVSYGEVPWDEVDTST